MRRSAPSRLHGLGQRVIPARLSQDSAAPSRAHGTAARLLLQLPPSSCSSSSSPRRHREPGHSCRSWATAVAGTRDRDPRPPGLRSAPDPSGPAARRRSTARMAGTTSSRSPAARSAPAPAPPLRGVLSRGLSAPRALASPSLPGRRSHLLRLPPGLDLSREERGPSALGLQSFSSGRCSRNKRGAGRRTQ